MKRQQAENVDEYGYAYDAMDCSKVRGGREGSGNGDRTVTEMIKVRRYGGMAM